MKKRSKRCLAALIISISALCINIFGASAENIVNPNYVGTYISTPHSYIVASASD